jgi:hypothetical protein
MLTCSNKILWVHYKMKRRKTSGNAVSVELACMLLCKVVLKTVRSTTEFKLFDTASSNSPTLHSNKIGLCGLKLSDAYVGSWSHFTSHQLRINTHSNIILSLTITPRKHLVSSRLLDRNSVRNYHYPRMLHVQPISSFLIKPLQFVNR